MIKTQKRSVLAILLFAISMTITFGLSPALAAPGANEAAASAEKGQSGLATVKAGPLKITPGRVNLVMEKYNQDTCFYPTIRLKIENTSAADVRIILFSHSIQVTDELGYEWFRDGGAIKSGGVPLSRQYPNRFAQAFLEEKGQFVTLSPQQTVETQISSLDTTNRKCFGDKDNELLQTHRPKTITFGSNIGIINLDNTTDIRAFSFSDLPVTQITTR